MDSTTAKTPQHLQKKAKTRSITYRLPEKIVEELEAESMQKNISQNVLVKQILEKYIQWDKFANKIGFIPVPNGILHALGDELDGKNIDAILNYYNRTNFSIFHPFCRFSCSSRRINRNY